MSAIGKRQTNPVKRTAPGAVILLLAVVLGLCAIPAAAWLFFGRQVAGVAPVAAPTGIYISAGNQEDVTYLDMSDIDVENGRGYQDFVFSVQGESVSTYNLQLAYTTNNQFTYTLYRAVSGTRQDHLVEYTPHDGTGQKYYKIDPDHLDAIPGTYLNRNTDAESLAGDSILANSTMHSYTYDAYGNVNRYAEPIYWQTGREGNSALSVLHRDSSNSSLFCDYYIIRVSWSDSRRNDRETDLIYIAASRVS